MPPHKQANTTPPQPGSSTSKKETKPKQNQVSQNQGGAKESKPQQTQGANQDKHQLVEPRKERDPERSRASDRAFYGQSRWDQNPKIPRDNSLSRSPEHKVQKKPKRDSAGQQALGQNQNQAQQRDRSGNGQYRQNRRETFEDRVRDYNPNLYRQFQQVVGSLVTTPDFARNFYIDRFLSFSGHQNHVNVSNVLDELNISDRGQQVVRQVLDRTSVPAANQGQRPDRRQGQPKHDRPPRQNYNQQFDEGRDGKRERKARRAAEGYDQNIAHQKRNRRQAIAKKRFVFAKAFLHLWAVTNMSQELLEKDVPDVSQRVLNIGGGSNQKIRTPPTVALEQCQWYMKTFRDEEVGSLAYLESENLLNVLERIKLKAEEGNSVAETARSAVISLFQVYDKPEQQRVWEAAVSDQRCRFLWDISRKITFWSDPEFITNMIQAKIPNKEHPGQVERRKQRKLAKVLENLKSASNPQKDSHQSDSPSKGLQNLGLSDSSMDVEGQKETKKQKKARLKKKKKSSQVPDRIEEEGDLVADDDWELRARSGDVN